MRRSNGTGSVYKLQGRRRKPWVAIITKGYELQDGRAVQKRHALGYYKTKKEAELELSRYISDPYEVGWTFSEVFSKWIEQAEFSDSSESQYRLSYRRFEPLHEKYFSSITVMDMERVINTCDTSQNNRFKMKLLLNQMYKYALKYGIVQHNLAERFTVSPPKAERELEPFTDAEIASLWNDGCFEAQMALVMIYTGLRIGEMLTMEIDKEEWLLKGGSKTEAGKNRIVPIREKIKPLMDFDQSVSYNAFYQKVLRYLRTLGHKPHDCRATFATRYRMADPIAVKLIMGHSIKDVTKAVYTKYTADDLRNVIESVDF